MRPLVIKFGGTSLATPARMLRCARRVAAHARRGRPVAVVVSATGHSTDRILAWAGAFGPADRAEGRRREVDRAAATGEALSAALFATALWTLGVPAASLGGGEAGVVAEGPFGGARIRDVRTARLRALVADGIVPVVAGFQGMRHDGETVTLGRGGSDTSAVALAAALGAECHIVTDVDGVYPRDPRLCPGETAFECLDHAALVSLAEGGAQVVHCTAARLAEERDVPLWIYSFRAPLRAPRGTRVESGASLGGALAQAS